MPKLSRRRVARKKAAKCNDGNIGFDNERSLVLRMKQKCNDEDPEILEGLHEDAADVVQKTFPDSNKTSSLRSKGLEEYMKYCDYHSIKISEGGTHTPITAKKLAEYLHSKVLATSEYSKAVNPRASFMAQAMCMLRHDATERSQALERALEKIPPDLMDALNRIMANANLKDHLPKKDTYKHFALIDEHVACMLRLDVGSEKWIERWNMFSTGLATGSRPGALGEILD